MNLTFLNTLFGLMIPELNESFITENNYRKCKRASEEIFYIYKNNPNFLGVSIRRSQSLGNEEYYVQFRFKKGVKLEPLIFKPLKIFRDVPIKIARRKKPNSQLKEYRKSN